MKNLEMNIQNAKEVTNRVWSQKMYSSLHENVLTNWEEAKSDKVYMDKTKSLFDLFGEELIIKKEIEITQGYGEMSRDVNRFVREIWHALGQQSYWRDLPRQERYDMDDLICARPLFDNKADNNYEFPSLKMKVQKGAKITRLFPKLFEDKKEAEQWQIKYSQLMNTKKLKGTLCLTIHPMDFLTMSYTSTWNSCYDIFNEGEYCAGVLEYMLSNNTMVAYLTTKDLDGISWNDKKWRCMFNLHDNCIMSGRNYPYKSDDLTGEAYKLLSEMAEDKFGKEYQPWDKVTCLDDNDDITVYVEHGYDDADYCGEEFYIGYATDASSETDFYYATPTCTKCGRVSDHIRHDLIVCDHCDDSFYCDHCDERCHGESYQVESWGGSDWTVCEYCYDRCYQECEICGKVQDEDNMCHVDGDCVCEDCKDKHYSRCEQCDDLTHLDNLVTCGDEEYCEYCAERFNREAKEQEELEKEA